MKLTRIAMVGAAGAAAAFFFDPDQGPRRRHQLADRAGSMLRRGRRSAMRVSSGGTGARALSDVQPKDYDDATLSEKVYTELNADPRYKGRVNVSAQNGEVVLVGEVDDPEDVVRRVQEVAGVGPVTNLLHRPGTPAPHMA